MQVEAAGPAPGFREHPAYAIDSEPIDGTVTISVAGVTLAETTGAIWLNETRRHPVLYVPRADVRFDQLTETAHTTYCPFKGDARYWSIDAIGPEGENAVWGYDAPFDEVKTLATYVAFYGDRVDTTIAGKQIARQAPGYSEY